MHVDTISAQYIRMTIYGKLLNSRVPHEQTSFIVAHRLSIITSGDMSVVIEAGSIVELGTCKELMAVVPGRYCKLYEELRHGIA